MIRHTQPVSPPPESCGNLQKNKIKEWLNFQDAHTLHRPIRKKFKRNVYMVDYIDETWQCDLNDMQSLKKYNGGYMYILTVIDLFSKYAWAIPLKNKSADEIIKALQSIFKQRKPLKIQSDKEQLIAKIIEQTNVNSAIKFNLVLICKFKKGENEELDTSIKTKNRRVLLIDQTDEIIDESFSKLIKEKSEFQAKGSGWALSEVIGLELRINKFQPLRGSTFIELPEKIKNTKSVINVRKNDAYCFKYSIWAKNIGRNPQRVSLYDTESCRNGYVWYCIEYPVDLKDVNKFEKHNNISINVFGLDEKNNLTRHEHQIYMCKRCLTSYTDETRLEKHQGICRGTDELSKIVLPDKTEKTLKFTHVNHSFQVPYVIYADFESILLKIEGCEPNPMHSYSRAYEKYEAYSFCYVMVTPEGFEKPVLYRGENAAKIFISRMKEEAEKIAVRYRNIVPMTPLTAAQEESFRMEVNCHICSKPLGDDRVIDHCHLTGKFRGATHLNCNLQYKIPNFLPIFIHNLSGDDSHFMIMELGYILFDSCHLLYPIWLTISPLINSTAPKAFSVISRLEYNARKLSEKCLPSKENFFIRLTDSDISGEDYAHATTVWDAFECKTLGDYSDIYLKSDVALLTDVFENFRNVCLEAYNLDPAWYYTAPGLTFDAMLKHTKIELELLTDYDMILMIEKAFLSSKGIKYYVTNNPDVKAAVVERFNRTLKTKITFNYVAVLPKLIQAYNNSIHSSIGVPPSGVNDANAFKVKLRQVVTRPGPPRFSVGDHVRISKERMPFKKGYKPNFTTEIFRIESILRGNRVPTTRNEAGGTRRGFTTLPINIFVYCNIIKPQLIGDSRSRCLRIVDSSTRHHIFNPPYYFPLDTFDIERIEIFLADQFGEKIPFPSGNIPSILILHFRRRHW
ncbi:hypothetical protein J437_LFUL005846 [Ladona fulva]|uniref:Integrase catalytic domain-containing protein n=1 Tax=Ladona fulva TaxID=123851 RepID=A0A8K0K7F4_LADFU|nr:hypothetical protein J437_LFUL005846 [Ladona fulva]